jgi:hypothetical protein
MPYYTFKDKNTGEVLEVSMKIAERDKFLEENPHMQQQVVGFPSLGDPTRLGLRKPDDGFRDVLRNVKHHHKKDSINTW